MPECYHFYFNVPFSHYTPHEQGPACLFAEEVDWTSFNNEAIKEKCVDVKQIWNLTQTGKIFWWKLQTFILCLFFRKPWPVRAAPCSHQG